MKSLLIFFTFYLFSSLSHTMVVDQNGLDPIIIQDPIRRSTSDHMGSINGLDPQDLDQAEPELTDDGLNEVDEAASGYSDDDFVEVDEVASGCSDDDFVEVDEVASGFTDDDFIAVDEVESGSTDDCFVEVDEDDGLKSVDDAEPTDRSEEASFINGSTNGIVVNSLSLNGWTANGWTNNGLTNNGADITLTGFTLSAIDTIRESNPDNTLDELIPYLVHCALPPWKSWIGTLNGEETEIWGEMGLAADLDQIPMLPTQQQLVSACLLTLVNYFGHHVYISSRNYPSVAASKDEMKTMDVYEGAFFGDLFSEDGLKKFACRGTTARVALSQSPDREWRRCTDPEYDCDIEVLGDCSEVCSLFTEDYGYSQCLGSDGLNYPALNVFLSKRNHNQ
jgi:hypothetical protein